MPCAEAETLHLLPRKWQMVKFVVSTVPDLPFPVEYFREWQNVGVSQDDGDTAGLQHITEGGLSQTRPAQNHTEWRLLWKHIGSSLLKGLNDVHSCRCVLQRKNIFRIFNCIVYNKHWLLVVDFSCCEFYESNVFNNQSAAWQCMTWF